MNFAKIILITAFFGFSTQVMAAGTPVLQDSSSISGAPLAYFHGCDISNPKSETQGLIDCNNKMDTAIIAMESAGIVILKKSPCSASYGSNTGCKDGNGQWSDVRGSVLFIR
jgi:hypothetical protein